MSSFGEQGGIKDLRSLEEESGDMLIGNELRNVHYMIEGALHLTRSYTHTMRPARS